MFVVDHDNLPSRYLSFLPSRQMRYEWIVAHPDITRSSNLNFEAVVLENGVIGKFETFAGSSPATLPQTGMRRSL